MLSSTLNLGVFVLGFKTDGFASDVSVMTEQVEGTILVLLPDNQVVYDSSGQYADKLNLIREYAKGVKDSRYSGNDVNVQEVADEDLFVFSSSQNNAGMQVLGLIPRHEVTKYADSIRSSIIAIDAICIAMLLVLIAFNTSALSKRVSVIKTAMKKLRGGDLSVRVSVSPEPDELGEIALSFNKMGDSLQEYIDKAYLFELRRRNAEYKYLQSQINPHFLYNTLEAIRMKAITAGDATSGQMIYKLALLMRSTIKQDAVILVSDELEYCGMYLDLIKVRYGDKLDFVINVEPEVMKLGMPRHLLQPVLENSIVHGFGSGQKRLECSINACISGDELVITIKDNGCGMDDETLERLRLMLRSGSEEGSSIGLVNVSERIRILYGSNCGIELDSQLGQGTIVTICIKALTIKEVNLLVQSIDR